MSKNHNFQKEVVDLFINLLDYPEEIIQDSVLNYLLFLPKFIEIFIALAVQSNFISLRWRINDSFDLFSSISKIMMIKKYGRAGSYDDLLNFVTWSHLEAGIPIYETSKKLGSSDSYLPSNQAREFFRVGLGSFQPELACWYLMDTDTTLCEEISSDEFLKNIDTTDRGSSVSMIMLLIALFLRIIQRDSADTDPEIYKILKYYLTVSHKDKELIPSAYALFKREIESLSVKSKGYVEQNLKYDRFDPATFPLKFTTYLIEILIWKDKKKLIQGNWEGIQQILKLTHHTNTADVNNSTYEIKSRFRVVREMEEKNTKIDQIEHILKSLSKTDTNNLPEHERHVFELMEKALLYGPRDRKVFTDNELDHCRVLPFIHLPKEKVNKEKLITVIDDNAYLNEMCSRYLMSGSLKLRILARLIKSASNEVIKIFLPFIQDMKEEIDKVFDLHTLWCSVINKPQISRLNLIASIADYCITQLSFYKSIFLIEDLHEFNKYMLKCINLKTFKLKRCAITDSHVELLLESLIAIHSLRTIDLSDNQLTIVALQLLINKFDKKCIDLILDDNLIELPTKPIFNREINAVLLQSKIRSISLKHNRLFSSEAENPELLWRYIYMIMALFNLPPSQFIEIKFLTNTFLNSQKGQTVTISYYLGNSIFKRQLPYEQYFLIHQVISEMDTVSFSAMLKRVQDIIRNYVIYHPDDSRHMDNSNFTQYADEALRCYPLAPTLFSRFSHQLKIPKPCETTQPEEVTSFDQLHLDIKTLDYSHSILFPEIIISRTRWNFLLLSTKAGEHAILGIEGIDQYDQRSIRFAHLTYDGSKKIAAIKILPITNITSQVEIIRSKYDVACFTASPSQCRSLWNDVIREMSRSFIWGYSPIFSNCLHWIVKKMETYLNIKLRNKIRPSETLRDIIVDIRSNPRCTYSSQLTEEVSTCTLF